MNAHIPPSLLFHNTLCNHQNRLFLFYFFFGDVTPAYISFTLGLTTWHASIKKNGLAFSTWRILTDGATRRKQNPCHPVFADGVVSGDEPMSSGHSDIDLQ
jgi:hypothetical protein